MRDYARISRICSLIKAYWMRYPDQRFFQLITNITSGKDMFYVEDDVTEYMLEVFLDRAILDSGHCNEEEL